LVNQSSLSNIYRNTYLDECLHFETLLGLVKVKVKQEGSQSLQDPVLLHQNDDDDDDDDDDESGGMKCKSCTLCFTVVAHL